MHKQTFGQRVIKKNNKLTLKVDRNRSKLTFHLKYSVILAIILHSFM
jgi:hypothetical protein